MRRGSSSANVRPQRTTHAARRRLIAIIALLAMLGLTACTASPKKREDAKVVVQHFADAVNVGDFDKASSFTTDPKKAAEDLNLTKTQLSDPTIAYKVTDVSSSVAEGKVSFDVAWKVLGNDVALKVDGQLVLDKQNLWKIQWSPTLIHPDLTNARHLQIVQNAGNVPVFLDRNGQPVLSQQLVTVIRITPAQVADPAGVSSALAGALASVVPSITADSLATQIASNKDPFTVVALRPDDAAKVQIPDLPGISSNKQARLLTTSKTLKSPALAGLNTIFQDAAKASTGWKLEIQDAQNKAVSTVLDVPAAPIDTISTTFDANLQTSAQAAVDTIEGQAVIVAIQPSTGGILAVAQNAAADAEGPIALTGLYPPGSSFKIVTAAAVLQAGIAQPDTVLPCPGKETIKGRTIPNENEFDLGNIPMHMAFAHSCNTTFASLGSQLPADGLHNTAPQFGLGVDYVAPGLTTITGKVPAAADAAEQVEDSIGQGKVVVSPIGMALAAATVDAGVTPLPNLVVGQTTTADQTPAAPSQDVITQLRSMMVETVKSGTATAVSDIPGIAGKTGTAQFGDGTQSHGWFVGYCKDMAFAVLLVGGGSSAPAVKLAGDFIRPVEDQIPG